jgi:hypothetical protein
MKGQASHPELEQQHVAAEQWAKDMEFYEIETQFFLHLVDRYFTLLLREENISDAQVIVTQIHFLQKEIATIIDEVKLHASNIAKRYDDLDSYDELKLRKEHTALESEISDCVEDYRSTKKAVFKLSARLIEVDKIEHLLGP